MYNLIKKIVSIFETWHNICLSYNNLSYLLTFNLIQSIINYPFKVWIFFGFQVWINLSVTCWDDNLKTRIKDGEDGLGQETWNFLGGCEERTSWIVDGTTKVPWMPREALQNDKKKSSLYDDIGCIYRHGPAAEAASFPLLIFVFLLSFWSSFAFSRVLRVVCSISGVFWVYGLEAKSWRHGGPPC